MKRSGFKKKLTVPLKRTGFKKRTSFIKKKSNNKKLRKDLMPNRVKSAIKTLVFLSHSFVKDRDGNEKGIRAGHCIDCGDYAEGKQFQAGHFIADSVGGILLRYHPHNMHGQAGGCNMAYNQERVKVEYTCKMIDKYGREYVDFLRSLKNKKDSLGMSLRADISFYERLIELYRKGDEEEICRFLHTYPDVQS